MSGSIGIPKRLSLPGGFGKVKRQPAGGRLLRLPSSVEGAIAAPEEAEEPQASGVARLGGWQFDSDQEMLPLACLSRCESFNIK